MEHDKVVFRVVEQVSAEPRLPGEDEDAASILRATSALTAEGWPEAGLSGQFAAWHTLVTEVRQGYDRTVADYVARLAVREWLALVLPMLTPHVQAALVSRLDQLDEQFREATVTPARPLPGAGESWQYRLPRVLTGKLAEDARRLRLVPDEG